MKEKKGISLITLVITIIVIIILAAAVILTLNNNNPIENAKEATFKSDVKTLHSELTMYISKQTADTLGGFKAEELNLSETTTPKIEEILTSIKSSGIKGKVEVQNGKLVYTGTIEKEEKWFKEIMGESVATPPEEEDKTPIDKTEEKIGYYADVDGNGTVDGVIYADLAFSKSGRWSTNGPYSYTAKTNTKDYYISQTNYKGIFGTKNVLTAIDGNGEDRFYVMALENFNLGTIYCWYKAAHDNGMDDYATATSLDFGTGKTNTEAMIAKWNSSVYGAQNANRKYLDMWGAIQDKVAEGWFVPSRGELGAFGDNLGITRDNCVNYGLSCWCWSSSQIDTDSAGVALFTGGYMSSLLVNSAYCVRLSTTF